MMQLIKATTHLLDSQGPGAFGEKRTESSTEKYSLGLGVFIVSVTAGHLM